MLQLEAFKGFGKPVDEKTCIKTSIVSTLACSLHTEHLHAVVNCLQISEIVQASCIQGYLLMPS